MTRFLTLRRCFTVIIAAVIGVAAPAYARAETMRLALDKGQVFTWEWKIVRSTETEGKPKQLGESATPVTLRVLDRTKDGYLLEIQNGRTVFDPTLQQSMAGDPAMAELLKFLETLKVQFLVTKDGEIGDIVNFDDVKAAGRKIIDTGAQNGVGDRAVLLRMFEQLAGSKDSLSALVLKDTGLMFYGTNIDPRMKEPIDFETELPNVFGGRPLKATGRLTLKRIDRKNKTAEFQVAQEVDKDSFIQMMKDLAAKTGKAPPKDTFENMMRGGSIRDAINVAINLDSGLATHAKRVRTSVFGNTVRVDQVEITLQK